MNFEQVTVFGGTGFLGRRIVRQLSRSGSRVRVAVRHPSDKTPRAAEATAGHVSEIVADIRDRASVAAAITGAQAVINAVSLYVEQGDLTFDAIHLQGAENVAREAANAGVLRLVHLSGLGADPNSSSAYVRARAAGESVVRKAFADSTILRPGVIFGPGDALFNSLARITRLLPAFPLFGAGDTLLQPVFVEDVAAAALSALRKPEACGQIYELGGPRTYPYKTLVKMLLDHLHRKRVLFPMPFLIWEIEAKLMSVLRAPPLTRDQVILMRHDNVVHGGALTFADLDIEPSSVESRLASCFEDASAVST